MSLRDIYVWAYHEEFGTLCRDARLRGDGPALRYPAGTRKGQVGWHISIRFHDLADLALKLEVGGVSMPAYFCGNWFQDCPAIARGEIVRLAIMAHGVPGQVFIDGSTKPPLTYDNITYTYDDILYRNVSDLRRFHSDLHTVGLFTRQGSTILLTGCLAGGGPKGTLLLQALSRVWPGRSVVAFSTLGYRHSGEMKRMGEPCEEPGIRDTDTFAVLPGQTSHFDDLWHDFERMPWASERSPHAKVAQDGVITRFPVDEPSPLPVPPAQRGLTAPPRPTRAPRRNP